MNNNIGNTLIGIGGGGFGSSLVVFQLNNSAGVSTHIVARVWCGLALILLIVGIVINMSRRARR